MAKRLWLQRQTGNGTKSQDRLDLDGYLGVGPRTSDICGLKRMLFAAYSSKSPRHLHRRLLRHLPRHELLSETDDFLRSQIQREVPGLQDVYLGSGVILLVRFCPASVNEVS